MIYIYIFSVYFVHISLFKDQRIFFFYVLVFVLLLVSKIKKNKHNNIQHKYRHNKHLQQLTY